MGNIIWNKKDVKGVGLFTFTSKIGARHNVQCFVCEMYASSEKQNEAQLNREAKQLGKS